MINNLEKPLIISASLCDNSARLSYPAMFSVFMDLAGEHGPKISLGMDYLMSKGLFWLTVKTKIKVYSRPKLSDVVTAITWPEPPGKIRCNRYYQLLNGTEVLVDGKTEWAIMEIGTGKIVKIDSIYPQELVHLDKQILSEPFVKMDENFDNAKTIDTYRVRSSDIDLGKHLNNAVYARIFFSAFSVEQLSSLNVSEIEINFRSPCYEGETLTIKERRCNEYIDLGLFKPEGKLGATMRITL